MVSITSLSISEVKLVKTLQHRDNRGFFSETHNQTSFAQAGISTKFIQDNHSFSKAKYTLRGLHFQKEPFAQDKLVRCLRGAILDVAIDLRNSSPFFGKYVTQILTPDNFEQLFIPKGFAHGFLTLMAETEVFYKVSDFYNKEHDAGLKWDDPLLDIDWGKEQVILSDKDQALPNFDPTKIYF